MKTTKEIAELFCDEIERIGKGEVRKDAIAGLEKCAGALIKLARLEMDYSWRNWENQKPSVPWLASAAVSRSELPDNSRPVPERDASRIQSESNRILDLQSEIKKAQAQLGKASPTTKAILQDKIQKWQDKIDFLNAVQRSR